MKTNIINQPDLKKAACKAKQTQIISHVNSVNFDNLQKLVKGKKYFIKTYGCQANVRDEETMRGMLEEVGYISTDDPTKSDLIIINTCAVRENAEDKAAAEIGNLKYLKKQNKDLIISLCGCMVEEPEILKRITSIFPELTLLFGTHEIPQLYDYLYMALTTKERVIAIESKAGEVIENLPVVRNNKYKAFVNIIYGCNKFCSYCIVPYTRGRERSRHFSDVIDECKKLVDDGYQEITLLGQNVNAYGKDLDEGKDFADLLEEVAKLGIPRLRFTTSHPWDFTSKMIDVIAKYDNIMKFIHLPVQSGNNEVLAKMGRRYTREDYINLVNEMKSKIPTLTLSTDIIVGFPNETEEQFQDTVSLVDEVKYDSAFTFIYSPRKGTPAAKMEDTVPYETKSKRFMELVKHLEVHFAKRADECVGKDLLVLVDGVSKTDQNMFSGYSESNKIVHFKGREDLIGKIIKVHITESHTYSLIGEIVDE